MKKVLSLTALIGLLLVTLTGCVNLNYEVELKKDGSANVSYTYETEKGNNLDDNLSEMKQRAKDEGYEIEEYSDDKVDGFKASKHFDNASEASLEKIFSSEYIKDSEDNQLKVEKQGLNKVLSQDAKFDLSSVSTYAKIKYTVKLPVAATSHNASQTSDEGKTLTWDLKSGDTNEVKFSATVKGFPVVPVVIAVVAVAAVACVVVVVLKVTKKSKTEEVKESKKGAETKKDK